MFSSTVKSKSLVSACGITPIVRRTASGSRATSCPSTRTVPAVIGISVVIIRINVDFPAPLGPSSPKISPSFTANETSSTAVKSPYRLTTCSTSTAWAASAAISLRPLKSEGAIPPPLVSFTSIPNLPVLVSPNPRGNGRPRPSSRAEPGNFLLLPHCFHAPLQLLPTPQHFRRHPGHIRALRILQPHLQRNRPYIPLPPPHIALRSKVCFSRLVKNFPRNHGPSGQPHPQ